MEAGWIPEHMNLQELWMLEYSPTQGQFRVARVDDVLGENRERFLNNPGEVADWSVLHIGPFESCERLALSSEHYMRQWGKEAKWEREMN